MSDSGRVTITLGRSGQVVKRDLSSADVSYASSLSLAGTKRPVRDRIGNNVDGYGHSNNKRHRGDNSIQNGFDDGRIDKDDLRLKLMRKSASKRAESNGDRSQIDLREKLTKAVRSPMTSFNSKQRELEPRETSMIRRIPSARSSDDLMRMESMRSSYSPWTLDHIRRRSPDGFPSSSRRISPQRNVEDLQRRPLNRTYESVTPVPYVTRDVESSRPPGTTPASFAARSTMSTLPPVTAKPVTSHLGQLPPSSSVAQRASYVVSNTYLLPLDIISYNTAFGLGDFFPMTI